MGKGTGVWMLKLLAEKNYGDEEMRKGIRAGRLEFFFDVEEKSLFSLGVEGVFEAYDDVIEADHIYTKTRS